MLLCTLALRTPYAIDSCQELLWKPPASSTLEEALQETFDLDHFKSPLASARVKRNILNENLASGKICLSNSPQASPFFFVKKKDGGLHLCQDYRYVNNIPFVMPTPFPSSPTLLTNYETPRFLPSLMSAGDTIMYGSRTATNGKLPSSPTRGYSNPQLCSSDSPTPLLHSNDS